MQLPKEVTEAYFASADFNIRDIKGGLVNKTYFIETSNGRYILQKLSPVFSALLIQDFSIITNHLKREGWEVQQLVETRGGRMFVTDSKGGLWRLLTYIPAGAKPTALTTKTLTEIGKLLAKLHISLAKLDYQPEFLLPHFHETAYFINRLGTVKSQLPTASERLLADKLIRMHTTLPALPKVPIQLIHGDPKTDNILFRRGRPFTWIDYDTVMRSTVWIDIGDMLRSLAEEVQADTKSRSLGLMAVTEAYRSTAQPTVDAEQFFKNAVHAAQFTSLELAARFLIDIVEDNYFDWDPENYKTRKEHNWARAKLQWRIYETMGALLD